MKTYYVYRVTNLKEHRHYIGSRGCVGVPTDDLGHAYFTSSKTLRGLFRNAPEQFRAKVIRTFSTATAALQFERKYQLRVQAAARPEFYNKNYAGERPNMHGKTHSQDTKDKIGAANAIANAGKPSPMKGKHHTPEALAKISTAAKLTWSDPNHQQKMSLIHSGHPVSAETRKRHAIASKKTWSDPAVRERRIASLKGKPKPPRTAEHARKISEALKRRYALTSNSSAVQSSSLKKTDDQPA